MGSVSALEFYFRAFSHDISGVFVVRQSGMDSHISIAPVCLKNMDMKCGNDTKIVDYVNDAYNVTTSIT